MYKFHLPYTECFDLALSTPGERQIVQGDFLNNFKALLDEFRVPKSTAESIAWSLLMRMGDTRLHYHTPVHVLSIFQFYENMPKDKPDLNIMQQLALWFHDAIYIPDATSGGNETQSADFAISLMKPWLPRDGDLEVRRHIIATMFHMSSLPYPETDELILDLDIWNFSADYNTFVCMGECVRAEYPDISDVDFQKGRLDFMKKMNDKPSIYRTAYFKEHYEAAARGNIAALLSSAK